MSERVDAIPGTMEKVTRAYREWVCPECDYFEDVAREDEEEDA